MSGLLDLLADSAIFRLTWSDVEFGPVLGKGASGLVRKAIWKRYELRERHRDDYSLLVVQGGDSTRNSHQGVATLG